MKKLFVAAILFLCALSANAQVKKYVGIVRQKYYPAQEEFLKDLSDSLKRSGYSSYSEYVNNYLKGGFGSGFIYVDKDGTNYVVTNRHVVSQAASASIEFENEDGSTKKYENLTVAITDDDIDLAILKFDQGEKPFKKGLTFNTSKLTDGQEVVSAGFPGLGGEPVWQFGKGSVTNASARIKDLIDPSISTVIQHSAQVDGGNSGGPLLVASKSAESGYEVAGINTWKAVGRESTNFSIPVKLVSDLIEKSKNPPADENMLSERKEKFKKAVSDSANDYTSIVKFISYDLASKEGADSLDDLLRHASTAVVNRVAAEFSYNPVEGLRYALAYEIYSDFSGENADDETLNKIIWEKEHGLYRIASTGIESNKKSNKKKTKASSSKSGDKKSADKKQAGSLPEVSFEGIMRPYVLGLNGGGTINEENSSLDFGLNIYPFETGIWGMALNVQNTSYLDDSFMLFGVGVILKVPLNFNLFCIGPKVSAGMLLNNDNVKVVQGYFDFGIETVFNFGWKYLRPGFEVSYKFIQNQISYPDVLSEAVTAKDKGLTLKLIIALSFD